MATRAPFAPVDTNTHRGRPSMGGAPRLEAKKSDAQTRGRRKSSISSVRRKSMNPNASKQQPNNRSRASSIGGRRSMGGGNLAASNGRRYKDPRPISDKGYRATVIRNVVAYLTQAGYPEPITNKTLLSPTSRDIVNIFGFLYAQVDPNHHLKGKLDEELPAAYKDLKYPFSINKSSLLAVGSPHTWPTLLVALGWMVELLVYDSIAQENAEEALRGGSLSGDNTEKVFFSHMQKAYIAYLTGENDFSCLENEMMESIERTINTTTAEVDDLKAQNERLSKEIQRLKSEPNRVAKLESKVAAVKADAPKFIDMAEKMEEHKVAVQKINDDNQKELQAHDEELAAIKKDIEETAAILEAQDMDEDEVEAINKEKVDLEDGLTAVGMQREKLDQMLWDLEMSSAKQLEKTETTVQHYNGIAGKLQLVPHTAKNANGVHYEMRFNPSGTAASEIVPVDIKGTIKPALRSLRKALEKRGVDGQKEVMDCEYEHEKVTDALSDKLDDVTHLESRLQKAQEVYKHEKDILNNEISKSENEITAEREEALKMLNNARAALSDVEQQLALVAEVYKLKEEELSLERDEVRDQIFNNVDGLLSWKQDMERLVQVTLQTVQGELNDVKEMEQFLRSNDAPTTD
eukprot:TRINITY_DN1146_c0_g1_i1.p1 TRINITY_DN1146_c0_g1~~TRINITY_DN1146_c0_g1_i1.p1  ORF type:complete len:633 (-),score=191.06 TRINITY_DN1146_c0_g1_i1:1027-2925(-)